MARQVTFTRKSLKEHGSLVQSEDLASTIAKIENDPYKITVAISTRAEPFF